LHVFALKGLPYYKGGVTGGVCEGTMYVKFTQVFQTHPLLKMALKGMSMKELHLMFIGRIGDPLNETHGPYSL